MTWWPSVAVRFSITGLQSLRNIIEAIPEEDWTPDVAETRTVSDAAAGAAHRKAHARFPTGPLRTAMLSSPIGMEDPGSWTIAATLNAIRDLKYGVASGRFSANGAWLDGDLARWTAASVDW